MKMKMNKTLLTFLGLALALPLSAGLFTPIVQFQIEGVGGKYQAKFELHKDFENSLVISHKGNKVARCRYSVTNAFDKSRSRAPGYVFKFKKEECTFVRPTHKKNVKLNETAYLSLKEGSKKSPSNVVFRFMSDQAALRGKVSLLNSKKLKSAIAESRKK